MAAPKTLARIDSLAWILIYAGLFGIVLGIASHGETRIGGWTLSVLGTVAVVAGIVLIGVRSRLHETPEAGAQSNEKPGGPA